MGYWNTIATPANRRRPLSYGKPSPMGHDFVRDGRPFRVTEVHEVLTLAAPLDRLGGRVIGEPIAFGIDVDLSDDDRLTLGSGSEGPLEYSPCTEHEGHGSLYRWCYEGDVIECADPVTERGCPLCDADICDDPRS